MLLEVLYVDERLMKEGRNEAGLEQVEDEISSEASASGRYSHKITQFRVADVSHFDGPSMVKSSASPAPYLIQREQLSRS